MNPLPSCPTKTLLGNKCLAAGHDCGTARNVRTWEVRNVLPRQSLGLKQESFIEHISKSCRFSGHISRHRCSLSAILPAHWLLNLVLGHEDVFSCVVLSVFGEARCFLLNGSLLTLGQFFGKSGSRHRSQFEPAPGSSSFQAPLGRNTQTKPGERANVSAYVGPGRKCEHGARSDLSQHRSAAAPATFGHLECQASI